MEKYDNREWIYDQYVTQDMTLKQIAEMLGTSLSFIQTRVKKFNIEKPTKASYNNTNVEILCHQCKEPFTNSLRHIARRIRRGQLQIYCTHKCSTDFNRGKKRDGVGLKGADNPSWKGGVSPISENLRESVTPWKKEIMRAQNFTCYITEKKVRDFHIHHITPFHEIRDRAIAELGITLLPTLAENDSDEFSALKERIYELHKGEKGYVITAELHKKFHSLYGFKTTEDDLLEFKTRYRLGELSGHIAI